MWGKKKQVAKSHVEKISDAHGNVLRAIHVFEKAKQEVVAANEQLKDVVTNIKEEIERLQNYQADAESRIAKNEILKSKFDDLTV